MRTRDEIILWFVSWMVLTSSLVIAGMVFTWVDDWEGNIEGALLPLVASAHVFALLLFPLIYCWGVLYRRLEDDIHG